MFSSRTLIATPVWPADVGGMRGVAGPPLHCFDLALAKYIPLFRNRICLA